MHHQGEIPQQDHKFTSNLIPPRKWARIFNNPWNFLAFLGGTALLRTWIQGWRQEILFISWFNEALLLTSPFSMLPAPGPPDPSPQLLDVALAFRAPREESLSLPEESPIIPRRIQTKHTHTHIHFCWGFFSWAIDPFSQNWRCLGMCFFCLLPKQRKKQTAVAIAGSSFPTSQPLWGFKEPCLSSSIRKRWISPFCWWMTRLAAKEMPVTNWATKKTTPTFILVG